MVLLFTIFDRGSYNCSVFGRVRCLLKREREFISIVSLVNRYCCIGTFKSPPGGEPMVSIIHSAVGALSCLYNRGVCPQWKNIGL